MVTQRIRHKLSLNSLPSILCVLMALVASACNLGPDPIAYPQAQKLVFPFEGQLGDPVLYNPPGNLERGSTAAMVIESNYNVLLDGWETHDLHTDRIDVWVYPLNGEFTVRVAANVRSVFTLQTPPSSKRQLTNPGATFTTVLFDLPNEAQLPGFSGTPPFLVEIRAAIDGVTPLGGPKFSITGNQGFPNPIADEALGGFPNFQAKLEPQRMIRLRGKRDPDPAGGTDQRFYEDQGSLASIEFDFSYPNSCLSDVRAYPNTEAATATTIVSSPIVGPSDSSVHVLLVKPDGFDLEFHNAIFVDNTLAGSGPFIDLTFTDKFDSPCDISDPSTFSISNLLVTNTDGATVARIDGGVVVDSDEMPVAAAELRLYAVDVEVSGI